MCVRVHVRTGVAVSDNYNRTHFYYFSRGIIIIIIINIIICFLSIILLLLIRLLSILNVTFGP